MYMPHVDSSKNQTARVTYNGAPASYGGVAEHEIVAAIQQEEGSCLAKHASKVNKTLWGLACFLVGAAVASVVVVVAAGKTGSTPEAGTTNPALNGGSPTPQPTDSGSNPVVTSRPTPAPTAEPTSSGLTGVQTPVIGYYSWSWNSGSSGPSGATIGCAFTGYTDVTTAISEYRSSSPALQGEKCISLGGGNDLGKFTASDLTEIANAADQIKAANYEWVMFDVENAEGDSATLIPLFATAFANLKNAGLRVAITTSHTAPYQTDSPSDAIALVQAWVSDSNVDVISPQLYSSGLESSPEFAATWTCQSAGCTWDLYKNSLPIVAPSIVSESHYASSVTYFEQNYGITLGGYFIWEQL